MTQNDAAPQFLSSPLDAFRVGMTPAFTARRAPTLVAVCGEHGTRTFGELNARANQLVRALRARGLVAGDGVALLCKNRPEFVEVYAAVIRAGWRLTTLNWHLHSAEAAYVIDDCDAKAVIIDAEVAEISRDLATKLPTTLVKLSIGGELPHCEHYGEVVDAEDGRDIDDPSPGTTMLYTSGTTGRPKGVARTGAAAAAPAAAPANDTPLVSGRSTVLCTGPLYHAAPFAFDMVGPLHRGVTIVLMDKWEPEEMLRLIEQHRVTHSHMVATMFHRLLSLPEDTRRRYDLSSLQRITHGAAPTPVHVKQAMMEWVGPILHEYYAGTEGGGTAITPQEWLDKPGSVGKPSLGRVLTILDDDGQQLGTGEVGRVFFDAPEAGRFEYYKDADKTSSAYEGNRFTLGDHGYVDEDGYLFLTGRTSEVIISGGVNIYPAEIDAALLMHPRVADAATVGVPHDEYGEAVKAVVVPREGVEPSDELAGELIEFCRGHLARFKCPRTVDFVDSLPRSDAGKLYRSEVRAPYWKHLNREV